MYYNGYQRRLNHGHKIDRDAGFIRAGLIPFAFSQPPGDKAISFNLLHKTCGSHEATVRLHQGKIIVPAKNMMKTTIREGQYVIFEPSELKAMEEAGTASRITEFVPVSRRPVYFNKAYYLA